VRNNIRTVGSSSTTSSTGRLCPPVWIIPPSLLWLRPAQGWRHTTTRPACCSA
jgi:hypothetical protein